MQKKSSNFLKKEIEKLENIRYIEGITFEQLEKISDEEDEYYIN